MEIIQAKKEDAKEIAKINVEDWQKGYAHILGEEHVKNIDIKRREKRFEEKIGRNFIIAKEQNKVIGFSHFGERRDEKERFREYDGEIYALYVKWENKKKGIGKALVSYSMKELKKQNKNKVLIWCLKENKDSRAFYEKIGGKLLGEKTKEIGEKDCILVAYGYDIEDFL